MTLRRSPSPCHYKPDSLSGPRQGSLSVSLFAIYVASLLVVAVACSGHSSEYQAQRQEMVDALHRGIADEDLGGLDFADESRCIAEGVVSAFSDSRFAELGLDAAAPTSLDEVLDIVELTDGEKDEILEVLSSCVDWEAFVVAALTEGVLEEGIPEESAQCLVESVSEESIDVIADAVFDGMSAEILGEEGSSEDNILAEVMSSASEEMRGEIPRCMRLG